MSNVCRIHVGGAVLALIAGCSAPSKLILKVETPVNPWTHLHLKNDPRNFQFAIVTDRTGGARRGIFESAVEKLNLLQPEFVMSVGDLIGGYTEDEQSIDRQWDEFNGFVQELEMPFFYVPGNHDITNAVMARKWKERHGRTYYHFVYRDVLFLCLNSQDPPHHHLGDEQIEYMAEALSASPNVRWTLVFLHGPLWTYSPDTNGWSKLEALRQGRPYTVFAGHEHAYTKYVRHDMRHFVLATTGGGSELRGPLFGEFDHVAWVTMTPDGPLIAILMLEGIWDENIRTAQVKTFMDQIARSAFIQPSPILVDDPVFRRAALQLKLVNDADVPMQLTVDMSSHAHLKANPKILRLVLPPNSVETHEVKLETSKPTRVQDMDPLQLSWVVTFKRKNSSPIQIEGKSQLGVAQRFPIPRHPRRIEVDGRLDDWPTLPYVVQQPMQIKIDPGAWKGPEDCSFRFGVSYDDKNLYIALEVTDDASFLDAGKYPWEQDGVEIRLDARPDPERSMSRGEMEFEKTFLFSFSPGDGGEPLVVYGKEKLPAGSRYACVKTAKGHNTEIALPIKHLNRGQGKIWEALRINVAVDDFDGPEDSGSQIWWRPDWRTPLTYSGSGTFFKRPAP